MQNRHELHGAPWSPIDPAKYGRAEELYYRQPQPLRAPQRVINHHTMARDRRERRFALAMQWVAVGALLAVIVYAVAQAPSKLRADLRTIEAVRAFDGEGGK